MSATTATRAAGEGPLESGTEITPELRPRWLAERRRSIGASDVAAIVGADPHRTALDVYMGKLGLAEPEPESFAMWFGTRMEPVLAEAYERETGRAIVARQRFLRGDGRPWLTATLDGLRGDGRIVEFKTVNARNRQVLDQLGEPGTDEIPASWMWQVTQQMAIHRDDVADLAVLVGGGDFRVYTVRLHPRLMAEVFRRAEAFWARVEAQDPPPPTSPDDARHLATLYRETRGEVELGCCLAIADEYEASGRQIRLLEEVRKQHRLTLLTALGPADVGRLPDGRVVRRSVVEVRAHEVKAGTQVRLSIKGGDRGQD